MNSSEPLPKEEVERRRALLRALQEESTEEEVSPERWRYRMAACVLSTFDPAALQPFGGRPSEGGALRWLVEDCEVVGGAEGSARWSLKESVRREAIARLGSPEKLREALRRNPVKQPDALQRLIMGYLRWRREPEDFKGTELHGLVELLDGPELAGLGLDRAALDAIRVTDVEEGYTEDGIDPPFSSGEDVGEVGPMMPEPPEEPDSQEPLVDADALARLLQVIRWFGPVVEGPERCARLEATLGQHLARARLLAPFQKLAGPTFRGRKDELEKLRVHVGVLDRSVTKTLSNYARRVLGMGEGTSLLIHGPGGMGKSALLARFILEHNGAVPFAYLDFDSPQVSLDRPATLLLEASRQLALQYPDSQAALSAFEVRCRKALADERERRTGRRQAGSARELWVPLAEEFGELLMMQVLHRWAEQGGPYLLLLDTFEEVQHRNADLVRELEHLLSILRGRYPQLRVVLSGRAPEPRLKATELVLKGLDEASALSLLEASGVKDEALRRGLHAQVGGNPLSLKLAAEVARVEGADAEGLQGLKTRRLFFFAAREAVVQGQLYRRVLEHVHDPAVRKLAHPGLIVRRMTPEVIQEVLAGPCGLGELGTEQAEALFAQLQREVALVSIGPDGALYHRPDVRRVMLEPLRMDQPAKVEAIHAAAVHYYSQHADVVSRAEELYHRMASGQSREQIDPRWMPGVEPYLSSSLEELPAEMQAYAASFLGVDLPKNVWERAQLVDWERHVLRRLRELMLKGEPQWALEVLRERRERTPGSRLYPIEARVLILLGRQREAERLVEEGLDGADWDADPVCVLKLLLLRALLVAAREELPGAGRILEDADRFAAERICEPARVLPLMASVRLWRLRAYGVPQHARAARMLVQLLPQIRSAELLKAPRLYLIALDMLKEMELSQSDKELETLRPFMGELDDWIRDAETSRTVGEHEATAHLLNAMRKAREHGGRNIFNGQRSIADVLGDATSAGRALTTSQRAVLVVDPLLRLLPQDVVNRVYWEAFQAEAVPTLKPSEGANFGPLGFLLELMS